MKPLAFISAPLQAFFLCVILLALALGVLKKMGFLSFLDKRDEAPAPILQVAEKKERNLWAVVSQEEAKLQPYPYVRVTEDGSVHELDADDRAFLEEEFAPSDSGRPYVKWSYEEKNGWGKMNGLCARKNIPPSVAIDPTPILKGPPKSFVEFMNEKFKEGGVEFVKQPDGSYRSRKIQN